jgi:hypothetical protein
MLSLRSLIDDMDKRRGDLDILEDDIEPRSRT